MTGSGSTTPPQTVRAFLAIELPDGGRSALAALVAELDAARLPYMRTMRPENIHLTIKFLGDVPATQTEAIITAVSKAAAACSPFKLEFGAVGVYPSPGRARVLWVGLKGDRAPLIDLHARVESTLASLGFEREARPYSPHLTVARIGDRASASGRQRAVKVLHDAEFQEGLPLTVGSIVLMRSELSREGALHYPLARSPLRETLPRDTP